MMKVVACQHAARTAAARALVQQMIRIKKMVLKAQMKKAAAQPVVQMMRTIQAAQLSHQAQQLLWEQQLMTVLSR
jgi:hypothetical protein